MATFKPPPFVEGEKEFWVRVMNCDRTKLPGYGPHRLPDLQEQVSTLHNIYEYPALHEQDIYTVGDTDILDLIVYPSRREKLGM